MQQLVLSGVVSDINVAPLEVTRGAQFDLYLLVSQYSVDYSLLKPSGVCAACGGANPVSVVRSDLTGATITLTVKSPGEDGEVILTKTTPVEIEILDQSVAATKGIAVIHWLSADTENLDPDCCLEYEIWVHFTTDVADAVIDRSPFCIVERLTAVA